MSPNRCVRHALSTDPDGLCALCHRDQHAGEAALVRKRDRPLRTLLRVIVALAAGLTTFGLLLAVLDRADRPPTETPQPDSGRD